MTINGGNPHAVGDRGQRFEVTYFDSASRTRKVFGWAHSVITASAMCDSIDLHPSMSDPHIDDRLSGGKPV